MASNDENKQDPVVDIELPAPAGWIKKFTPRKGGTPRRNDIVFVSPTGEVIKNKRQLEQYLKSHTGGPAASEFDWGSGDSPRRSVRLSEKLKVAEVPENESPKKKQKTSILKRGAKQKNGADGEYETTDDKDATVEETKESAEVSVACAEDAGDEEVITEGALPEKPDVETTEKKTEGEEVLDEPVAVEIPNNAATGSVDAKVEESKDATTEVVDLDAKVEESKDATTEMADPRIEESKDATAELADAKANESVCASGSAEKGTPVEKVGEEKVCMNLDNAEEKQAVEKPDKNDTEPAVSI